MNSKLGLILLIIVFGFFLGIIAHWMDIVNFQPVNFPSGYPLDQSIHSQAVMEFCALPPGNHSLTRSLILLLRRNLPDSFNVKLLELRIKNLHQAKLTAIFLGQLILCFYLFYQLGSAHNENDVDASLSSFDPENGGYLSFGNILAMIP